METTHARVVPNAVQGDQQLKHYGGIRRGGFFLGAIGVYILGKLFEIGGQELAIVGLIITLPLSFFLVVNRLKNTGMSGWWSLLILVPIVNLIVGTRCFICQEGFQDTKKLDKTGKIICGLWLFAFAVSAILVAIFYPLP